jgi:hypothetical protein
MKVQIVGKREINFTNRETGELVSGLELHYVYESRLDDENFEGMHASTARTFDKRLLPAFSKITVGSNAVIDTESVNGKSIIVDIYEV